MCLDYFISEETLRGVEKRNYKAGVGYKVYLTSSVSKKLYSHCFNRNKLYPIRRWIKDSRNFRLISATSDSYRTGYHIFLCKKAAIEWMEDICNLEVRKVKFRKVSALGMQSFYPFRDNSLKHFSVVVAREILIESNKRKV